MREALTHAYERCFPIKSFRISDDDCPWMTKSLKKLDMLRKREFYKNKKSPILGEVEHSIEN